MVVDTFRYYAGAPERTLGDTIPVAGGVAMTFREPLGVVALITPWNFPLTIASWKLAPGAGGRQHGRAQAGRADAADRAAVRADRARGRASPRAWSTSSSGRARRAARGSSSTPTSPRSPSPARPRSAARSPPAAAQTIKRVTLELGGKSANVVFADADLAAAAAAAAPARVRQRRPGLLRALADPRRAPGARRVHGRARGARRGDPRRRPARRGDRDGPADLRRPARDGRLLRARRRAGRDPRLRARRAGLLVPADRAVPGRPRTTARCARRSSARWRSWCRSATRPRRSRSPTTRSTGSRARSGRATARRRCASRARSRPACSRSTRTRRCASRRRSAASSSPATAASSGRTRSTPTPSSRPSTTRRGLMGRLDGKVCVITGAASGIGAETVRRFEEEGATVVGVDLRDDSPGVDLALACDVADEDAVREMFAAVRARVRPDRRAVQQRRHLPARGRLGARHRRSTSGSGSRTSTCRSVFLCCKHGIPHLLETGGGSVINTASFVATMGAATSQIAYTASKGAVLSLSRELGVEFARRGVRVNALCPGPVNTPLLEELFATDPAQGRAAARARADGPLRRGARDRQRRAVPRLRRVLLHHRVDVPRRRRHLPAPTRRRSSGEYATSRRAGSGPGPLGSAPWARRRAAAAASSRPRRAPATSSSV